jgi:hypothetical protein
MPLDLPMLPMDDYQSHVPAGAVALPLVPSIPGGERAEVFDYTASMLFHILMVNVTDVPITVRCLSPGFGFVSGHDSYKVCALDRVAVRGADQHAAELVIPAHGGRKVYLNSRLHVEVAVHHEREGVAAVPVVVAPVYTEYDSLVLFEHPPNAVHHRPQADLQCLLPATINVQLVTRGRDVALVIGVEHIA